jgi:homospermidine synthase
VLKVRNRLSYDRTVFHTASRHAYTRLNDCSMNWYLGVWSIEGKKVEAEKPVLYVGTFWGEWSQWRNRLPHEA